MIGGAVLGLKRAEIFGKFASIEEFAGIGDYMDQPVKHYSMGMRTRLAFSICAHVEAEILVVDEALAVGDAAFQRKCMDWIDSFRKTGTLLFVSHSMAEVPALQSCGLDREWAHSRTGIPAKSFACTTKPYWSRRRYQPILGKQCIVDGRAAPATSTTRVRALKPSRERRGAALLSRYCCRHER